MDLEEKQISENTLYRGKVITVQLCGVELPNGHESVREVVRHSGGAASRDISCEICPSESGPACKRRQNSYGEAVPLSIQ